MVVPTFWLETQAWSMPPYTLSLSVIMEHRLQGLYGTLHPPNDLFSPFFHALLTRALTATRTVPWLRAAHDRSRLVVLQVDLEPHALAASVRHTPTVGHPVYYVEAPPTCQVRLRGGLLGWLEAGAPVSHLAAREPALDRHRNRNGLVGREPGVDYRVGDQLAH